MSSDTRDVIGRSVLRQTLGLGRGWFAGAALALAAVFAAPAANAAVIATAAAVVPAARGELGGAQVTILQGAQLEEGQLIVTDAGGEVQITFVDNTRMVIGPNSSLLIESFLMRNDGTFGNLAVNALGGTFRFISGNSPSEAYHVSTPAGTISVRGTKWDLTVNPFTNIVNAMVYVGSIMLCPYGVTDCTTLRSRCLVANMIANTIASVLQAARARERFASQTFPYAVFQTNLLIPNQIENAEECADEQVGDPSAPAGNTGTPGTPAGNNNNPTGPRPNEECPSSPYSGKGGYGYRGNFQTFGGGGSYPPCTK